MARKAVTPKPKQIGSGAIGNPNPTKVKSPLRLPGQPIPGNKVPKGAGVTGNPKVKRPIQNTTGSKKIGSKTVGY
jgi:hypothetical protein